MWRQLLQQLVHPAEGSLAETESAAGGAAAAATSAACPPVTMHIVRLLSSAAQSQLSLPVDLSPDSSLLGSLLVGWGLRVPTTVHR